MMHRIRSILKDSHGGTYVETAISMMCILFVVVFALNIFSFFVLRSDMDYFSREMIKTATANGDTGCAAVSDRYDMLCEELGQHPVVSWNATYFDGSKVQYGEPIQVNLTIQVQLSGMGLVDNLPMTLNTSYSGLSQKYWK